MDRTLPPGKLPPDLLAGLLANIPPDPSVIVGPGIGRDAAAIRVNDGVIVVKTDPITFATGEIGWYTVNVNANDIACLGATPRWMLVTALLPERSTTPELVDSIFSGLCDACAALGISLVGGHTEITTGLDRPILVGQLLGQAGEQALIDPRRSKAGDRVILARGVAIEGTTLIARELPERLEAAYGVEFVERCRRFLHDPGISVVAPARILRDALGSALHALHDPTEGGLATGLRELGLSAGLGISVDGDAIPIYDETRAICDLFGLDPLGLIASGALLAVVDPSSADVAVSALRSAGIPASIVGTLEDDPSHVMLRRGGLESGLPEFAVDELARLVAEGEDT